MIEVDSLRRPFHIGHYEPTTLGSQPMPVPQAVPLDKTRVLVHWNNEQEKGAKSDEDDDENDEYRPFTPPPPRERLSYTRYQLELLNGIYNEVRYPNSTQKQLIAKRVGITREQVKIWFQNRRRKDVVGAGKSKANDESNSSVSSNSSKDSEKADENESSSEESVSGKDSEESVVPQVVLKSVIAELVKFINDPLKGKKNRKKAKSKHKAKAAIKKGLTTTLIAGGYDMVSPPNQITPSAFFEKVKNGFNHSKGSSAFEIPRDGPRPVQINGVSSTSDRPQPVVSNSSGKTKASPLNVPYHGSFIPNSFMSSGFGGLPLQSHPPNMPVLSDLFSYRAYLDTRQKELSAGDASQTSSFTPSTANGSENNRNIFANGLGMSSAPSGRYLGGIFPYPYIAEQPMLLSSIRQPDQIFRPSPQYALSKFGEDPYQPLMISSLSNPYYSPPTTSSWSNHNLPGTTTYTNL